MPEFLKPEDTASAEELERLMSLGIAPDQQALLKDQMSQAQALRNRANPEMRGNGRVMTAANPLEFVGAVMQKRQAGKDIEKLKKDQQDSLSKQAKDRALFYELMRRGGNQGIQADPANPTGGTMAPPTRGGGY
jgi:hypothetical protein